MAAFRFTEAHALRIAPILHVISIPATIRKMPDGQYKIVVRQEHAQVIRNILGKPEHEVNMACVMACAQLNVPVPQAVKEALE